MTEMGREGMGMEQGQGNLADGPLVIGWKEYVAFPDWGGTQFAAVVGLKQRFKGQARHLILTALGDSARPKWVIVVEMTGAFWERCRLIPFDGSARGVPIGPADGVCTVAAWSPDGTWMPTRTRP